MLSASQTSQSMTAVSAWARKRSFARNKSMTAHGRLLPDAVCMRRNEAHVQERSDDFISLASGPC